MTGIFIVDLLMQKIMAGRACDCDVFEKIKYTKTLEKDTQICLPVTNGYTDSAAVS
jgi:hypothetical protein